MGDGGDTSKVDWFFVFVEDVNCACEFVGVKGVETGEMDIQGMITVELVKILDPSIRKKKL